MPIIRLQFSSQSNNIFSTLVRWRDWSDYSHVDLIMPDGRLIGAYSNGVVIGYPHIVSNKIIVSIVVTQEQADKIYKGAMSQLGKPYDYAGIFGFVTNRDWQEDDSWFCSELIAWIFKEAGINLLRFDNISRISPADLLLSPLLQ